ncbi:MAG: hypothetical protein LBR93_04270 [Treponema sp.]|nr:hypothetical protein [Treponema sp.]
MKKQGVMEKARFFVLLFFFFAFVFSCKSAAGRIDAPPAPDSPPPAPAEEAGEEPSAGPGGHPLPEPSAPEIGSPGTEAPFADETPWETLFAGEPDLAVIDVLPEPFMDLPETDAGETPPGETLFAAALPEPAAPILPEPAVSAAVLPQPPEPPPPPVQPPVPASAPEQPPVPAAAQEQPPVTPPPPVQPPVPATAPEQPPVPPPPPEQPPVPAAVQEQPPVPAAAPEQPARISPSPPPFIRPAGEAPAPAPARTPVPLPPAPPAEPPAWTRQNQAESRPSPQPAPASPAEPSPVEPSPAADEGVNFSRIVRATVGQLVEIPFRGTGWVYLGEMGSRQGLAYGSRRLDPEGQSFIFRAEEAGTYGLKFYKQDFVRDYILNDYVQVIVGESPEAAATGWFNPVTDRGRSVAEPRWPTAAEEAEAFRNPNAAGAEGVNPARGTQRPAAPPGQAPAQGAALSGQPESPAAPPPAGALVLSPAPAGQRAERTEAPAPATQTAGRTDAPPPQAPAAGPARSEDLPGQSEVSPAVPAAPVSVPPEPIPAETPPSGDSSPPAEAASGPEEDSPDHYLRRAREEFEAGRVAPAIALLDRFRERSPAGSDETWWLYGQFYEANSPSRDIRSSLDYYRRLLREYPQSSRCNDARKRIAYLERYYINIR